MKKSQLLSYAFLTFILLSACKRDRSIDPADAFEFEAYLKDEMDAQNISALSVTLFRGNTLLYENYLGLADRENNIPLNSDHIFLLASVSKTITATALMQLFEQGEFALDDNINDRLSFQVKHPDSNKPITYRHLLTHTSGISDAASVDDQYYYGEDSPSALKQYMQDYLSVGGKYYDERDNFEKFSPGDGYAYSNIGAALMGVLVEEIAGIPFDTYCQQHIFQPLGMTNTFWHLSQTDTTKIVRPYEYKRKEFLPQQHYTFTDYPNGGLRANGLDLMKFCAAYLNGGNYNGAQLLQASTISEMLKVHDSELDANQGLSFYILDQAEGYWGHEGGEVGATTVIAFHPGTQNGVIILTNATDVIIEDLALSAYRLAQKL